MIEPQTRHTKTTARVNDNSYDVMQKAKKLVITVSITSHQEQQERSGPGKIERHGS